MSGFDWLALPVHHLGCNAVGDLPYRKLAKARIEKGVQHHFDLKIESVEPNFD
jgi:hypothetical protein